MIAGGDSAIYNTLFIVVRTLTQPITKPCTRLQHIRQQARKTVLSLVKTMSVRRRTAYALEELSQVSRFVSSDGLDVVSGQSIFKTKTDSDTPEHGAVIVQGGQGISKNLYVGNDLHVLCRTGGSIVLGSPTVLSDLQILSRLTTDFVPYYDARFSLGQDDLRWHNLSVDQVTSPEGILIKTLSEDDDVGVTVEKLFVSGPFNCIDNAVFQKDVTVQGHTNLQSTHMTLSNGDFLMDGPGNVKATVDDFTVESTTFTWNATDQTRGVNIATNADGIPFFFGDANSTCTFNGNLVLVKGDLEVQGGTTVIQSQTVTVRDKVIELGYLDDDPTHPSTDETSNGGGIILKGSTDKYIEWFLATDPVHPNAWGFSENIDVAPDKYVRTDDIRGRTQDSGLTISDDANPVLTVRQGLVGINQTQPSVSFQIVASDAMQIPVGTTQQQPAPTIVQYGMIRYNTSLHRFEGYIEGDVWSSLQGFRSVDQNTYGTVMADDNTTNNNQVRFFTNGAQVVVFDQVGQVGINVVQPVVKLHVEGTDAIKICVGPTSDRPDDSVASVGMIRYNTDRHVYEGYYDGDIWNPIGGLTATDQNTYITLMADDNYTNVDRIRFFVSGSEVSNFDPSGKLGLGIVDPVVSLHINAADALMLPAGTSDERPDPSILLDGMIRYNTDLNRFEGYGPGNAWVILGGVVDLEQTTYISVLSDDSTEDVHRIRFFTDGNEVAAVTETGHLGIGDLQPRSVLSVSGDAMIGSGYCSEVTVTAPADGLLVQTQIGVGLPNHRVAVRNTADIAGRVCIGGSWAAAYDAPADGLLVQGSAGFGIQAPVSTVDISGNLTIGLTYAGTNTGPDSGLLVEGNVGIGTTAPVVKLDIASTDAVRIAVGSTADRPGTQGVGMIRYNSYRGRFEGLRLTGGLTNGTDNWVSFAGVSNDTDKTFIDTYDRTTGNSVEEIYFYTNATFDDDQVPTSGMRMKVDAAGNLGIGGDADRVLGSILDVQSPEQEQVTFRYDYDNYGTFWSTQNGEFKIRSYALDHLNHGDISIIPAGSRRSVIIGDGTDIFDPNNVPNKLKVYGYVYTTYGIRFPDGSIQATSSSQSPTGEPYGNWKLGSVNAGVKSMSPILDTTQIAIGCDLPTAKLTVMKVAEEAADFPHLELRMSDLKYSTFTVDDSGTLNITAGLASDSDILLNPTGNVGVLTDNATASLHVDYDFFLQKNNSPDNTTTSEGLYMRYQSFQDGTPSYGLIASGDNSTTTQHPLRISASQLLINDVVGNVGINTTTPASKLSVCGNAAIGATYGSTNVAPTSGLIVETSIGAGTTSPCAGLEALAGPSQTIAVKATQKDHSVYGLVIGNNAVSTTATDGLKVWSDDLATFYLDSYANSLAKPIILQPSGGQMSVGSTTSDAQLTVTQPGTISAEPVISMHQSNPAAAFAAFTGTAVAGSITNNIVVNDANVTAARIQAFVQIQVTDTGGLIPAGSYYLPFYTLV